MMHKIIISMFVSVCLWQSVEAQSLPPVKGSVVLFYQPSLSMEINAVSMQAIYEMTETFDRLGRFLPVEQNRLRALGDRYGSASPVD